MCGWEQLIPGKEKKLELLIWMLQKAYADLLNTEFGERKGAFTFLKHTLQNRMKYESSFGSGNS